MGVYCSVSRETGSVYGYGLWYASTPDLAL